MCVYIVQYYAINLMFNSDGVAAFLCGEVKESLLQDAALTPVSKSGKSSVEELELETKTIFCIQCVAFL